MNSFAAPGIFDIGLFIFALPKASMDVGGKTDELVGYDIVYYIVISMQQSRG